MESAKKKSLMQHLFPFVEEKNRISIFLFNEIRFSTWQRNTLTIENWYNNWQKEQI